MPLYLIAYECPFVSSEYLYLNDQFGAFVAWE